MPIFTLPILLPKLTITPIFEARERYQRRVNKVMNRKVDDSQSLFEQRYQVGASFTYGSNLKGKVVYLYGNQMIWQKKGNLSVQNSDLYLGEVDPSAGKGQFQLGRQLLKKGGQRIVEESGFGNRLKSFDLARFIGYDFDVFAGKAGVQPAAGDQSRLAGGSYDSPLGETLLLFKHDRSISKQDYWTGDQRYTIQHKGIGLELEAAGQEGKVNGLQEKGWFLHGRVGTALGKDWGTWLEADAFSGGIRGNNGLQWTAPYQPAHDWYGVANMFGPRNLNALQANVSYQFKKGPIAMLSYNRFSLRDPSDGWYSTANALMSGAGGVKYIDPTGKSGRGLGDELDLRLKFYTGKHGYLWAEAATIQPGDFIKTFNGANTLHQWWGFVSYTFNW